MKRRKKTISLSDFPKNENRDELDLAIESYAMKKVFEGLEKEDVSAEFAALIIMLVDSLRRRQVAEKKGIS